MSEDREVLRAVWDGKLPVSISMAPEEVDMVSQPERCLLMVPRVAYLPLLVEKVKKHFSRYLSSDKSNLGDTWFEYNSSPIKWHYPVGVLYDLLGSDSPLPWSIVVHFSEFPEHQLLRLHSKEAVESLFLSTVKEADALKHRGTVVSSMQKKEHTQLWLGLLSDRFDQFWSVNRKLMDDSSKFRSIPLRIHQWEGPYIQRLLPAFQEEEQGRRSTTLLDALAKCLPSFIPGQSHRVTLHGIEPPLDVPLHWLSCHMSYPDNFLHLVAVPL